MDSYRLFLDGVAVGVLVTLAGGYLLLRLKQSRANRSKDDIDRLIDEFQDYYRKVEEEKADPYDERGL
jgi:hypothetical protein